MRLPPGWKVKPLEHEDPDAKFCIKLKKNLYGCKQAAKNWHLKLSQGLIDQGFTPSEMDPCLFMRQDCLIALCADDCCIFGHSKSQVDESLNLLIASRFKLRDEGAISNFLRVKVNQANFLDKTTNEHKTKFHLTQTGLMD